ncbi:bifunctional nuclease family protein [Moheibacter lacus]|uniref:Bifunctional nuclease family protein n=1 Tax=Moheibacter lacus TaxID=2745851 RepID=A0A838ZN86_9FLAO|nr:bifunctional nuclease family protein [Moheibacter lacus]MBA5629370.1 bifunctional nuclease family protein [Moheibacter lacus]
MENLVKLNIKGISYSQTQTGAYALILEEELGMRKLPIIIGSFEAQSIALALEKDIRTPRPLTHDLFVSMGQAFNFFVKGVFIHKLEDGVFYSNILMEDKDGKEEEIDSRTSDAIALAIRFDAPIFALEKVMEKAGIHLEVQEKEEKSIASAIREIEKEVAKQEKRFDFSSKSKEELEAEMKEAVKKEDYELAARLRDELDKR